MFLYSETFSKDIGTIFRIYFSSILHISAPALCYPVKTNKRKSQQSKWSCFKSNTSCTNTKQAKPSRPWWAVGTTPVVIDVHPNGYTNATNLTCTTYAKQGQGFCCDSHCGDTSGEDLKTKGIPRSSASGEMCTTRWVSALPSASRFPATNMSWHCLPCL